MPIAPKPRYFASAAEWRAWLERNHATAREVLVGFHKRATGRPSLTWSESVDQALCFGWIDGRRRSLGPERYAIRFTPRQPGSTWSNVNIRKVKALAKAGRMTPAGLKAFRRRAAGNSGVYGHEQRATARLRREEERQLRANQAAWADWRARPPSYRKVVTWWVVSAQKPETRARRLAILIRCSAAAEMVPPMVWTKKKHKKRQ